MSVASWLVSDSSWMVLGGFRWFQVVPGFSKYIDVLIKKCSLAGEYPENSVSRGGLTKNTTAKLKSWVRKEQIIQNIYL